MENASVGKMASLAPGESWGSRGGWLERHAECAGWPAGSGQESLQKNVSRVLKGLRRHGLC